jgi:hypothetical protein
VLPALLLQALNELLGLLGVRPGSLVMSEEAGTASGGQPLPALDFVVAGDVSLVYRCGHPRMVQRLEESNALMWPTFRIYHRPRAMPEHITL